jgi:hypothetical protein
MKEHSLDSTSGIVTPAMRDEILAYTEVVAFAAQEAKYAAFLLEYQRNLPVGESAEQAAVMSESDTSDITDTEAKGMWKNAAAERLKKSKNTTWKKMSAVTLADYAEVTVAPGLDLNLDDDAPPVLAAADGQLFDIILDMASISLFQSHQNSKALQESYLQDTVLQLLEMIALVVHAKVGVKIEVADATGSPLLYYLNDSLVKGYFKGKTDAIVYFDGWPLLVMELKTMLTCRNQLRQALLCGYSVERTVGANEKGAFRPLVALVSAGAFVVAQRVGQGDDKSSLVFSTYSPNDAQSFTATFRMLLSLCARLCGAKANASGADDTSAYGRATPCKAARAQPGPKSEGSEDDGGKTKEKQKRAPRRGLWFSSASTNTPAASNAPGGTSGKGKQRASGAADDGEDVSHEAQRTYVVKQRAHRRRGVERSRARFEAECEDGMREALKVLLPR